MTDKKAFRARVRAMIDALGDDYIAMSDAAITDNVRALAEYRSAERVFTYLSEKRECATRALIDEAVRSGRIVALPVSYSGGRMAFAEFCGALDTGALGIPEPCGELRFVSPTAGDIMIVPALCCDTDGYRLGRGGGYYDRYLDGCQAFTACLCREKLLSEKVPREWNDLPVSAVITECRVIRPAEARKN
jgi:5-formyltetrahydrofolate cyclo-ligase